jgi:phage gp29-like protein
MSIKSALKNIVARLPKGESRLTPVSSRDERASFTNGLDVDRVASIIRMSENGNSAQFWQLCRDVVLQDAHIQATLFQRKNAVLGDDIMVTPWDKKNKADVEAAEAVELMLRHTNSLHDGINHLMDAVLFPLSIIEKVYAPLDPSMPELGRRFRISELVPVPYRLIGWNQDGEPIVMEKENLTGYIQAPPLDTSRYVLHRGHTLTAPDRFGGPMRAIFFLWLLSASATTWWSRFLSRYGSPFMVGKHGDDDKDRRILEAAISYATQLGGIVISGDSSIELKEAAKDAGDGFEKFKSHCRREISRLILGQTLSSETTPTGMGSGTADLQGEVRDDIRKFDSRRIGNRIRTDIVAQWLVLNGYTGRAPIISFAGDTTDEVKRTAELISNLPNGGLELTDEGIQMAGERLGLPVQRKAYTPATQFSPLSADREVGGGKFFRRERGRGCF